MSVAATRRMSTRRMSSLRAVLVLGLLEAFGPLSMDLYLPRLPQLARSFDVSDALAQATMSACMIGLGLGQLVAGPLSDRFGRRRPLIAGVAAFAVLSALCAAAPTIETLLVARFLQGLAGSAGIVISLAVARDLFTGVALSRMLSLLLIVSGTAPIVAPIVGGQLAYIMDWRGVFWVLGGIGVCLVALVLLALPETLPPSERHAGGMPTSAAHASMALRDHLFRAVLLAGAAGGVAFFAYLSMSSFVMQEQFGLTPQSFSLVFAACALASIGGGQISRALVVRLGPVGMYLTGVTATLASTALVLALALSHAPGVVIAASLVLFMLLAGTSGPNGSTLALARHGARAGTAAALLGTSTFLFGPIIAPVAALGGTTALTMATTMAIAAAVAAAIAWTGVRRAARALDVGGVGEFSPSAGH